MRKLREALIKKSKSWIISWRSSCFVNWQSARTGDTSHQYVQNTNWRSASRFETCERWVHLHQNQARAVCRDDQQHWPSQRRYLGENWNVAERIRWASSQAQLATGMSFWIARRKTETLSCWVDCPKRYAHAEVIGIQWGKYLLHQQRTVWRAWSRRSASSKKAWTRAHCASSLTQVNWRLTKKKSKPLSRPRKVMTIRSSTYVSAKEDMWLSLRNWKIYYEARGNIDQLERDVKNTPTSARSCWYSIIIPIATTTERGKLELNSMKNASRLNSALVWIRGTCCIRNHRAGWWKLNCASISIRERIDMDPINRWPWRHNRNKNAQRFHYQSERDLLRPRNRCSAPSTRLKKVASKTFMEAFEKIKEHFIRVFQSVLFYEGDACDLKLTDPTKPLESEIEIIAKPKASVRSPHQPIEWWRENAYRYCPTLLHVPVEAGNRSVFSMRWMLRWMTPTSTSSTTLSATSAKTASLWLLHTTNAQWFSTDVIYGITMVRKGFQELCLLIWGVGLNQWTMVNAQLTIQLNFFTH